MNINYKKILVLAPHTDDGELGAGGSISRFIEQGAEVTYVAFSTAEKSVPDGFPKDVLKTEVKNATQLLGISESNLIIFNYEVRKLNYVRQEILEALIKIRNATQFDLVLVPSLNDIHQDHITIAQEAVRAFKQSTIWGYELIWNNLQFNTTCFVKLEDRHVQNKVKALTAYRSQQFRDYTSEKFIYSLAHTRGVQIGSQYAESFEVIRSVL